MNIHISTTVDHETVCVCVCKDLTWWNGLCLERLDLKKKALMLLS